MTPLLLANKRGTSPRRVVQGLQGGGTPWGMPGMSDTPNEFVLQSLDGSNRYLGEFRCYPDAVALILVHKHLFILLLLLFPGLYGSFLTTQYTSTLFQC